VTGLLDITFQVFAVRISGHVSAVLIRGAELLPQTPLARTGTHQREL
jgi:hypothetical protein